MKTLTVDQAMTALRRAIDDEARERLRNVIGAHLGRKPIVSCVVIEDNTIYAGPDGAVRIARAMKNGHAPKPKRKYRLSPAGRAKRIAAVKRYWKSRRKAGK